MQPSAPHQHTSANEVHITPSILRRMACWLYEGVLLFGVVFITNYLASTLTQTRNSLDNRHLHQLFLFIVLGVYFTWFWAKGQTLAMKTWDIRVVNLNGATISQTRAFFRYLLSWLWFIPPLAISAILHLSMAEIMILLCLWVVIWAMLARLHPKRQFLHDAIAGTRLIHHVQPTISSKKPRA